MRTLKVALHRFAAALSFVSLLFGVTSAVAFAELATGRDFTQRIKSKVGIEWKGNPLRDAFASLSTSHEVAIFLDRRVVPEDKLNFRTEPQSLAVSLDRMLSPNDLGWSTLGPLIVIGPRGVAERLPSLAAVQTARVGQFPANRRGPLLEVRPMKWQRLARPRDLVNQLAREANLTIDNLDEVPHDLWPETTLPPLSWAARMALVLNSFDLMLKIQPDGKRAEVTSIPAVGSFERVHETPVGTRVEYTALRRAFPDAKVSKVGSRFRAAGDFAEHDRLAKWLLRQSILVGRPSGRRPQGSGGPSDNRTPMQVYDLKIDNQPAGGVLQALAKKFGLTPKASAAATQQLRELVSFDVKQVGREELLQAAAKPAGLKCRVQGTTLEITTVNEP